MTRHMNDEHGCSKCKPGQEMFERLECTSTRRGVVGVMYFHYDYRTPSGRLFSTVAPNLEEARARRDSWLVETGYLNEIDVGDDDQDEGRTA